MNSSLQANPSWPSLYNPRHELFSSFDHRGPIQPEGIYLTDAGDVFRFILYWTLVFYVPIFVVLGLYAFLNLSFPPKRVSSKKNDSEPGADDVYAYAMSLVTPRVPVHHEYETLRSDLTPGEYAPSLLKSHPHSPTTSSAYPGPVSPTAAQPLLSPNSPMQSLYPPTSPTPRALPKKKKPNARRSRVTFALIVFMTFLVMSLIGAVVSSAIVGYVLAGLYKAGRFYMSTWVPFLWALISVFIGMMNVWPSVIDFI